MTHDELQNNSSDTGIKVPTTHDELLAKINDQSVWTDNRDNGMTVVTKDWNATKNTKALRAVVKQAQPMHYKFGERQGDDLFVDGWNLAMRLVIQTITKELG